jgi:Rrf2 family nitric oxide-sensitive transcriptional repressor
LTVLEVINAIDPIERIHTCPLGLDSHGPQLCLLHRRVDDALRMIEESFGQTTIKQIVASPSTIQPLCRLS